MDNVLSIRSLEDLNKLLSSQQAMTRRVKEEITQFTLMTELRSDNPDDVAAYIEKQKTLLFKYLLMPTLYEHKSMTGNNEGLVGKWGATFGVMVLLQDFIIEQVMAAQQVRAQETKSKFPANPSALRQIFLTLLLELSESKHEYLYNVLEDKVSFTITDTNGAPLPEEERVKLVHDILVELTEMFMIIGTAFGLVEESDDEEYSISPMGTRLVGHLIDGQRYLNSLVEAHKRFQNEKPRLRMV
jgi:hypothetical protein